MTTGVLSNVASHLRRVAGLQQAAGSSDEQLLARFSRAREEAAFEALVRRHGPMVLAVCRRILNHSQDAEDAFQATFVVLVRKAGAIGKPELLSNWLYGVAYRTALRARSLAAKRRSHERQAGTMAKTQTHEETCHDLRPVLDEELNRLPVKYRAPVVLCYLEGKTTDEAASQLGWPRGTVSGRLARAKDLLRGRLARRGLALGGGMFAATLGQSAASASVPVPLVMTTVKAAMGIAAGKAVAGAVTAPVAVLAEGVLKTMFMTKLKIATVVLLAVSAAGAGSFWTHQALAGKGATVAAAEGDQPAPANADKPAKPAPLPKSTNDKEKLQGIWKLISAEMDGQPAPAEEIKKAEVVFAGDEITFPPSSTLTYKLDTTKKIKVLYMKAKSGPDKDKIVPVIYELKGDDLKLCWDAKDGKKEPTEFAAKKGSGLAVFVLKRQAKGDRDLLQGRWLVVSAQRGYKGEIADDELGDVLFAFEGNKFIVEDKQEGFFELDQTKKPKTIDFKMGPGGNVVESMQGIYELQGESLKLCFGEPGKGRPEKFSATKDSGQMFVVLRKLKPGEEKPKQAQGEKTSSATKRIQSQNNLKQIALAMHNYHDANGSFPPAAIYDKNGKPLLSWRVLILPYIEQDALFKEFKLDEPWDSEHNKKLIQEMPKVYAPLAGKTKEPHSTFYQVFTGKGTVFEGKKGISLQDVTDGTSNTVLAVEAEEAVVWSKPADLPYDAKKPLPKLGGMFKKGFNTALCDGSVHFFSAKFNEKAMRLAITRNDGETFDFDDLHKPDEKAEGEKPKEDKADAEKPKEDAKEKTDSAALRTRSANNLKQIAIAMHNYHDTYNNFPPAAIFDKNGKPLLSWRVMLLPYLDHADLYKEFKLDEPWDSAHNKKLLAKIPKVYAPLAGKAKEDSTYYQVFTGKDTVFNGMKGMKIAAIKDGTSNTILAVEAEDAVPWTKPEDLPYDAKKPLPKLGGMFTRGIHVLFCDGSVRMMPTNFSEKTMRALITPAGGEVIEND